MIADERVPAGGWSIGDRVVYRGYWTSWKGRSEEIEIRGEISHVAGGRFVEVKPDLEFRAANSRWSRATDGRWLRAGRQWSDPDPAELFRTQAVEVTT